MNHPPGPPPQGPPPAWTPPPHGPSPQGPPPQGPPPMAPPPGWAPPPGPPGGFPPYHGPRRSYVGLIVGLTVLGVLTGALLVVGAVLAVRDGGAEDRRASEDPATPVPSSTPTPSLTPPLTPPPTPPSSPPALPTPPAAGPAGDVEAADFPGDWAFRMGAIRLDARLRTSSDHDSCGPVEDGAALTGQGCRYAVQWVYDARGGAVRQTQVFLVFDSAEHARVAQRRLHKDDLDLPPGSTFDVFTRGKWISSVHANIVGVTIGTARSSVTDQQLVDLVSAMNSDFRAALAFKL